MARVLIVTASMGAGHTEVAAELARRLADRGASVRAVDMLEIAGPAGRRLRRTYRLLLARAPWLYDAAMRFWARHPAPLTGLVAANAGPAERALRAAVTAHEASVVVSTYNLASQVLGRLRARGELRAPVVTVVIDPGAHPYWVSRYVQLHIAPLVSTARRLTIFGAPQTAVAAPILRPEIHAAPPPEQARRTLGLPDRRIALVNAGSWAAGRIRRTVAALCAVPDLFVVALCGRDERLRAELTGRAGLRPVGWTSEMATYLAAADVMVDNAGGLTCWEALAIGTPVVIFDPLPGHGRFNAAALADDGLVVLADSRESLAGAVRAVTRHGPLPTYRAADPAEDLVLATARDASHV
ncbi:MAG TPA: glycosyltransferase [Jatrophihabitans sp.]|nr:glycosyltransferase [Jatrophihabitans sp.]